jgi:hypothetical protein
MRGQAGVDAKRGQSLGSREVARSASRGGTSLRAWVRTILGSMLYGTTLDDGASGYGALSGFTR